MANRRRGRSEPPRSDEPDPPRGDGNSAACQFFTPAARDSHGAASGRDGPRPSLGRQGGGTVVDHPNGRHGTRSATEPWRKIGPLVVTHGVICHRRVSGGVTAGSDWLRRHGRLERLGRAAARRGLSVHLPITPSPASLMLY